VWDCRRIIGKAADLLEPYIVEAIQSEATARCAGEPGKTGDEPDATPCVACVRLAATNDSLVRLPT
jgi:hypothetical protein